MNETGQINLKNCNEYIEIEFFHPKSNSMPRDLLRNLANNI